ncbi:MAG: hypothetical protein J6W11_03555 [Alphaproteobacteria bacterium]|nr:hypothetical protein [Alphaproteobacteria bacterium]
MKQKNSKWIVYIILFALLGTIFYLSMHKITPVAQHIEKDITASIK